MSAPEIPPSPPSGGEEVLKSVVSDPKSSWANVVRNKTSLTAHAIDVVELVNGSGEVEVPDAVVQQSTPLWEDFLIGKFVADAPHVAKIHVIVNKIWPLGDKSIKIDVFVVNKNTVKFRIKEAATRRRVLNRRSWDIAGIPMRLSKWSPIEEKEEEELKVLPMWITLKKVPHRMYSWGGLGFIASAVGKPIRLHPETELCSSFEEAKVLVEADLSKEFPKSYRLRSKTGMDAEVEFVYPRLPVRCNTCFEWGHLRSACSKQVASVSRQDVAAVDAEQSQDPVEPIQPSHDPQAHTAEESSPISIEHGINDSESKEVVGHEDTEKDDTQSPTSWSTVSPAKVGRSGDKKIQAAEVGSPSRFAVLGIDEEVGDETDQMVADVVEVETDEEDGENVEVGNETEQIVVEEEEVETDEENGENAAEGDATEEGEILVEEIVPSAKKQVVASIRIAPPRVGKGTHKYLEENFKLTTKDTLSSASSKSRKPKNI
ncbi:hypothetical protein AALP_AA3G297300 [Arabis alpina]|uniref:DUF4283 domain-containing protein n=1 Tax=Arabis alpina TaxID=50452 RepID=A0A087HCK3_ARAAL|nr:hypothetical protein AALP_AA3G297300 [Arabis alpina]